MRPGKSTGAHLTAGLAELVCSNSLGSNLPDRASGVAKKRTAAARILLMELRPANRTPAGNALAVDREAFPASYRRLSAHPTMKSCARRSQNTRWPNDYRIWTLTSDRLSHSIASLTGESQLYFFDAMPPLYLPIPLI